MLSPVGESLHNYCFYQMTKCFILTNVGTGDAFVSYFLTF